MNKKGITLMEAIAIIVVMSLAIPVLLRLFADVAYKSARSESISVATFYAEQLLEEIKLRRFDESYAYPWSSSLGPDTSTKGLDGINNETTTNKDNWDDVDDFNGYSDNPAAGYTRSVTVDYVTLSGTTWQHSASIKNYKRIRVNVSRGGNLVTSADLETIMVGSG